jgi:hypothetical protein
VWVWVGVGGGFGAGLAGQDDTRYAQRSSAGPEEWLIVSILGYTGSATTAEHSNTGKGSVCQLLWCAGDQAALSAPHLLFLADAVLCHAHMPFRRTPQTPVHRTPGPS